MAEFDDSLLHFDNIKLDVNENPSRVENHLFTDIDEPRKTVPLKTDVISESNLTFSETLQSLENTDSCIERPESTNEINSNKIDLLLQNVEKDNSRFNETYPSATHNNCTGMPKITNEILNNELLFPSNGKEEYNNRNSDSGIHDSENNIVENTNKIDFEVVDLNIPNDCTDMITVFSKEESEIQFKDEEFHDAVQFFKDPSSFTFLENAGSTNAPTEPLMTRSSLYVNFDPLHAKFYSKSVTSDELHEIAEDDIGPEVQPENIQTSDAVNKHLANVSPRESLGNILISFDSPLNSKETSSLFVNNKPTEPQKLYTEEEFQQALKIQELSLQEIFLKRQQDLELTRTQKQQELETKICKLSSLCKSFHCSLKETIDVAEDLFEKKNMVEEKFKISEVENNKLKEDLKTSVEDLQSVESTFSDFHKRYEQCKSVLKVCTQNEDNLKQELESMKVQLQEKEEMYKVLKTRTEEMLDKANTEVANVKKAGDAQVAVLTAQLKKAELKISSLESDVKHVKIENSKLSNICDELMAKVSEGN